MIKNIIIIGAIVTVISSQIFGGFKFTDKPMNSKWYESIGVLNNKFMEVPHDREKIEKFWTDENKLFLNANELEILNELKTKVESGKNLTVEERGTLSELRSSAIKKKLGDERYERYKKLIEKRQKQENGKLEIEMTKEEKREIYLFEKEISGKK